MNEELIKLDVMVFVNSPLVALYTFMFVEPSPKRIKPCVGCMSLPITAPSLTSTESINPVALIENPLILGLPFNVDELITSPSVVSLYIVLLTVLA